MAEKKSRTEVDLLLLAVEQAFEKKSWHGTNLRGMTAAEAAWRPAPGRHNVWELTVHAAYWKYAVVRRIRGDKKGSFPLPGSNWFVRGDAEPDEKAWKADVALLVRMHRELKETMAGLDDSQLSTIPAASRTSLRDTLLGIAAHDLYHCGQIQLLKRLRQAV